ncbi:MAG: TSUP family transporter [Acidobacteriota bacterium]
MALEIVSLFFLTFIAAGVDTLTGFGTSTIMVPVLLLFFPLPLTLLFVGIIHWFGDIWKMLLFKSGMQWRLLFLFGGAGLVASYFGASLIVSFPYHP